jgi:excisionase family DNA binding protein
LTNDETAIDMAEVARRLGLSRGTVVNMVTAGELPSVKLKHRRLILVSDLNAFLNARRVIATEGVEEIAR